MAVESKADCGRLSSDELEIYKAEWAHCEQGISRYDTLTFQVRGWSISVTAALLGAAFTLKRPEITLVSAFTIALFWTIEAMHKIYQGIFIDRSSEIQELLQAHMHGTVSQDLKSRTMIAEKFNEAWRGTPADSFLNIGVAALPRNVASIYAPLLLVSTVCYWLVR